MLGYLVERRDPGTHEWIKCNAYNVPDCEFTVPNLIEFNNYEFRITAVNAVGKGEPSEPTTAIKIQETAGVYEGYYTGTYCCWRLGGLKVKISDFSMKNRFFPIFFRS